jgi:autophagy-related protein 27
MVPRPQEHTYFLVFIFVSVLNIIHAKADSTFDCNVRVENLTFDLTTLAGERVITRTRETPPTTMIDSLRFNLCADLDPQGGVPEQDQVRSVLLNTRRRAHLAIKSSVYLEPEPV